MANDRDFDTDASTDSAWLMGPGGINEFQRLRRWVRNFKATGPGVSFNNNSDSPTLSISVPRQRPQPNWSPDLQVYYNNVGGGFPDPLPAYSVLAIDGETPFNQPPDAASPTNSLPAFQRRPILNGYPGGTLTSLDNFVVTTADIPAYTTGPCAISGMVPCMVVVDNATMTEIAGAGWGPGPVVNWYLRAGYTGDPRFLVAGWGPARIVWIDPSPASPQPTDLSIGYPNSQAYWAYVHLTGDADDVRLVNLAPPFGMGATAATNTLTNAPYAAITPVMQMSGSYEAACPTFYAVILGPPGLPSTGYRDALLVRPLGGTGQTDPNGAPIYWIEAYPTVSVTVQIGNPGFDADTSPGEYTGTILASNVGASAGFPPLGMAGGVGMGCVIDNMTEKGWTCPKGNVHLLPPNSVWEGRIVNCDNSSPPVPRVQINAPVNLDVSLSSDGGNGTSSQYTYTVTHRETGRVLAQMQSPTWQPPKLPQTAATHGLVSFDTGFILGPTDSQYNPS